jgi:hypothetical protein
MKEYYAQKKEILLRKNKGKSLIGLYKNDLKLLLCNEPYLNEFITLEDTDFLKDVIFERNFYKDYDLQNIDNLDRLIKYFSESVVSKYSYLFSYYSQYCGAIRIKTKDFFDNYMNIKMIKSSIASILSEDLKNEFLIDFDNGKINVEIRGEQWIKIVDSFNNIQHV